MITDQAEAERLRGELEAKTMEIDALRSREGAHAAAMVTSQSRVQGELERLTAVVVMNERDLKVARGDAQRSAARCATAEVGSIT